MKKYELPEVAQTQNGWRDANRTALCGWRPANHEVTNSTSFQTGVKKNINFIGISFVICLLLGSCGNAVNNKSVKKYFNFTEYFKQEVAVLTKLKAGINKTVQKGDNPETYSSDSVNWKKELAPFFDLEINLPLLDGKYETEIDSNGTLVIVTYYTKDTTLGIQRISMTSKNGKIQLIEADMKKHSFIVDRETKLSYQPKKGYGIVVKENYIWSKPGGYEIFAEIKNPEALYY